MEPDESRKKPNRPEESPEAALLREKEALAQQVKRLIRAEGALYEYQQVLDAQLKEYKDLYELTRRINSTFNLADVLNSTVRYLVEQLEYERAVILRREEAAAWYVVSAVEGYYEENQKAGVVALALPQDAPCLLPILKGEEYVICTADTDDGVLCAFRDMLLMHEYFLFPLGSRPFPNCFLAVGNSAENAVFHRRIVQSREGLLGLGNLVGLVSSQIENRIYYEQLEEAREQERLAEAKYRSIFENALEGIFQRSPEGRYLKANRALARTFGYASPEEIIEQVTSIREQLYVDPRRHDELMALLEAHGAVEGFEAQMHRKDGSVIWVSISLRAVRDGAGKVLHYEGMSEDVTKRKRAEEALRESEQKYRQLSEALEERVRAAVDELRQKDRILILQGRQAVMGEMISNIAHQWRQPLNMLALLIQELQMTKRRGGELSREFVDENTGKSLEIIRQMSKTIDYFRYFFRSDQDKVEFRVLETIERTLALLDGSFRVHDIRTDLVHTADPVIVGFPTEFVQVLLNILINARDALVNRKVADPSIRVKLYQEGERTVLTIADNAGGVPDEIIDRIFEPYFTTKGPEQGTGIGLFMSKTIIEKNMCGSLTVRNVGGGAEFRIEV